MTNDMSNLHCPIPKNFEDVIALSVGEGAKASRKFLDKFIYSRFNGESLNRREDAALVYANDLELAFTTDSFVVEPYFFPGGDIGKLAVCGTVNDLCMVGAEPKWMSVALIVEEGFSTVDLVTILDSIQEWCGRASVEVVCGDTKVVPKGKMDGIFINTSAIGLKNSRTFRELNTVTDGDVVIVSGPIGCHGMSVMAARTPGLIETEILSDCELLLPVLKALRQYDIPVKAMRDATRGGVAAVMQEWAMGNNVSFKLQESLIPVRDDVRGLTELLGLDPLFVANEGTMVLVVSPSEVDRTLEALRTVEISREAAVIGRSVSWASGVGSASQTNRSPLTIVRGFGREIPLEEPNGALLPRIC